MAGELVDLGAFEVQGIPEDIDTDGVSDVVENAAPNGGDGNGDGIPDGTQEQVASLPSTVTGTYVTLESDDDNPDGNDTTLVSVEFVEPPAPVDAGIELPLGVLAFDVTGLTPGASATVTLTLHDLPEAIGTYWKYGPEPGNEDPHWYLFMFDGTTGAEINGNQVILHFIDGQRGDGDLNPDGVITDPGAPATNAPPTANDDAATTDEDTAVVIDVTFNDADTDGAVDPLTVIVINPPLNGAVSVDPATGQVTYHPSPDYYGGDSFSYTVEDNNGATSNAATVTLTINPINDPPVALADPYTTDEDNALVVTAPGVLGNDSDVEGNELTANPLTAPANGSISLNADGSFIYTPEPDFYGEDSFTYYAHDGEVYSDEATVTITVNPVNDPPVAQDDSNYSINEDIVLQAAAPGVLGNDADVEGDTLTATASAHGGVLLNADGSFTYTPAPDFYGLDSFTYYAHDGVDNSDIATVTITVNPVNDPPVAQDDSNYSVNEDIVLQAAAPGVLGNDADVEGDTLSAVIVSTPANGNAILNADGSFSYTPNANFNGTDSFTYQAADCSAYSDVATVTITVIPVNDAPEAGDDAYNVDEDNVLTVAGPGVLGNDIDVDGDTLTAFKVSDPAGGSLALNPDGGFMYTPSLNYNGPDSFTYQTNDGLVDSNIATVSITVNPVNDPPTITNPGDKVNDEGDEVGFPIIANDIDGDALRYDASSLPGNISIDPLSGVITGTLAPDANGNSPYTVLARVLDAEGVEASTTLLWTVNRVNDLPVLATNQATVTVEEGQTATNTGTVSDLDGDVVTLTASVGAITNNGDGSWSWNFAASDGPAQSQIVTIVGTDGYGGSGQATFELVVNNVPPTASFENLSGTIIQNLGAVLSFSNQYDLSPEDTGAGFTYSYDCTTDGIFEVTNSPAASYECVYPAAGVFTAQGRITDKDGGSTDYTVAITVQTPSEAITDLIDTVESFNLQQGIDNSLDAKLDSALQALDDMNEHNDVAAINSLQAFINAVEAQRDKKLTNEQADILVAAVQAIINSLQAS